MLCVLLAPSNSIDFGEKSVRTKPKMDYAKVIYKWKPNNVQAFVVNNRFWKWDSFLLNERESNNKMEIRNNIPKRNGIEMHFRVIHFQTNCIYSMNRLIQGDNDLEPIHLFLRYRKCHLYWAIMSLKWIEMNSCCIILNHSFSWIESFREKTANE